MKITQVKNLLHKGILLFIKEIYLHVNKQVIL